MRQPPGHFVAGTYPELHRRPELEARAWSAAYVQTYLERDVRAMVHVGSLRDFDRVLLLLAARTGALLSVGGAKVLPLARFARAHTLEELLLG